MHLLIALDEEDDLTLTASDAADGGDLDDVIDVLTAGGLRKSHHFVGVHWLPRTRVVAHGPVVATVTTTDGVEREIRAATPRVWTDVEFDEHPAQVDLRVLEESELATTPPPSSDPAIHRARTPETVDDGITRAGDPVGRRQDGASSDEQSVPTAAPRSVPTFGSVVDENESRPGRTWAGNWGAPSPSSDPSVHRAGTPGAVDDGITRVGMGLPAWGEARPRAVRQPAAATTPEPTPAAAPHTARDIHSTWTSRPSDSTMREVPPSPAAPLTEASTRSHEAVADDEPAAPSYDYLFGHTTMAEEHRKVLASLDAPADAEDEDDAIPSDLPEPPATQARAVEEPPAPPSPAPATPTSTPEPTLTGGLISSVPWASPSTSRPASDPTDDQPAPVPSFSGRHTPPPAPSLRPTVPAPTGRGEDRPPRVEEHLDPNTSTDDAELTVDRSALLQSAGPTVMAVLCPAGHASPPHANRCRSCGSAVPPQEAFAMLRPPLGVLRLSTGDVVTLDRNVLLGRAPKPAPGLAPDAQPHVVKVPSPERDVSRNHVEVLVDGWHVLLRDLGTTNGTTVALPGEAPVRLRANDEQSLEPGSVVSMADEVSFTFEVGG
jgi:hypothetical protein